MAKDKVSVSILDKFNKEQLYTKWQEEKAKRQELEEELAKKSREWSKKENILTKTVDELKSTQFIETQNEDVLKKILDLRAKRLSPVDIHYKLDILGIDIELEEIETFLASELPKDLKEYYQDKKNKWLESIKMNSKEYRYALLEELQTQLDRAKKYQEFCGDLQEAHAVGKDIRALLDSMEKVAKNLDDVSPVNVEKDRADDKTQEYMKASREVVKLSTNKDSDVLDNINDIDIEGFVN
jgi:hypothetical protein